MTALLRSGAWSFELRRERGLRRQHESVRFSDVDRALTWLRRVAVEPGNMDALRRLLAERGIGEPLCVLEGEAVLVRLSALLVADRVSLFRLPREPLGPLDLQPGVDEAPAEEPRHEKRVELTWITIQMVGEDDEPIVGERYRITLPDGSVHEGRLDGEGLARFRGIEAGQCEVTFPDLDQEAWGPIGTSTEM